MALKMFAFTQKFCQNVRVCNFLNWITFSSTEHFLKPVIFLFTFVISTTTIILVLLSRV